MNLKTFLWLPVCLAMCLSSGCAEPTPKSSAPSAETAALYRDLGDIRAAGELRVAHQRWAGFDTLPGEGVGVAEYERLVAAYAGALGVEIRWVEVDSFGQLLSHVEEGLADVSIGNITVTPTRRQRLAFSLPLSVSQDWLVGLEDGVRLGVPAVSSYVETARDESLAVDELLPDWQADEVFEAIDNGRIDRSIVDAVAVRQLLDQYPDIAVLERFRAKPLAWALHPDAVQLKQNLDGFIVERHLQARDAELALRDLEQIRQQGRLRMITVTGPHTYFLYKGELMGFDLELLQQFAESQSISLEVVVADDREHARALLYEGAGDVIAAAVTDTARRREAGWVFSNRYLKIDELLIGQADLRAVHVNPSTSHWDTAQALALDVVPQPALSTEELVQLVARGRLPATIVDEHLLDVARAGGASFAEIQTLRDASEIAWVVRDDQQHLVRALNEFIEAGYRGLHYNLLRAKYFGNERRVKRRERHRLVGTTLSPFDEQIRTLAEIHGLDWRLLVAQAYQESGFDPSQTSFAGARGLMQVMPRTARQLEVDPDQLWQPSIGLEAGVRYLAWCLQRFEEELPLSERTWFALAAYNAGPGHVRDARKLARQLGFSPDAWFGHVEHAMLKLSEGRYAAEAAHGYVRGIEPVNYVREIRQRYQAYVDHLRQFE